MTVPEVLAPLVSPGVALVRVAVVEDDAYCLDAFTTAIRSARDMQWEGSACTRRGGLRLLEGAPADVLVVDLGLPDGPGLDVIRAVPGRWPGCSVLVSTVFGDESHVIQCLEAGATGYVLKDSSPARIVDAIRIAQSGGSPISPLIARQLLLRFRRTGTNDATPPASIGGAADDEPAHLSPREQQVLEYFTKGFSYEEIAQLMGISRNTVLSFVRRIYVKLGVRSQIEAIHEARSRGLLAR